MCSVVGLQGFDVDLLEAGPQPGGLVAGWKTPAGRSVEVGIHGTSIFLATNPPSQNLSLSFAFHSPFGQVCLG